MLRRKDVPTVPGVYALSPSRAAAGLELEAPATRS
jgi:hypothetical protein